MPTLNYFKMTERRTSNRIKHRAKRTFVMPTRDDVFNDITETPTKLRHLTPNKKLNNYMKTTHRYNADVYDALSDHSSLSDFIDDDGSSDASSDISNKNDVKGLSGDSGTDVSQSTNSMKRKSCSLLVSDSDTSMDEENAEEETSLISTRARYLKKCHAIESDCDTDGESVIQEKKKRKHSHLSSDDDNKELDMEIQRTPSSRAQFLKERKASSKPSNSLSLLKLQREKRQKRDSGLNVS